MKKLLILTILIVNLLVVSQYAMAGGYGSYSCASPSGNPSWGGCTAWGGGDGWETYYKSTSAALYIEFDYHLSDNPNDQEYVWGVVAWDTPDPSSPSPFYVGLNKMGWDIDPTPRMDTYYDTYAPAGNIYVEAYATGYMGSPNNEMACHVSWW